MCLFNKTGEELNEYGRERTKQHFSNAKNPSYVSSRRVLAIENKNSVRMNRVFHVSPIFGKRRCAPLAATHIHTQRRILRGLCKLHVCIRTFKKHFMQFFISLNFFIFANYDHDDVAPTHTTATSPVKTSFSFFACRSKFFPRLCRALQLLEKRG